MSDLLIKGMKMPKNCDCCPLAVDGFYTFTCVRLFGREYTYELAEQRQEDCPLKELPPHGRLKDTDVIINTIKKATKDAFGKGDTLRYGYLSDVIDMIENAPTVLEASEE